MPVPHAQGKRAWSQHLATKPLGPVKIALHRDKQTKDLLQAPFPRAQPLSSAAGSHRATARDAEGLCEARGRRGGRRDEGRTRQNIPEPSRTFQNLPEGAGPAHQVSLCTEKWGNKHNGTKIVSKLSLLNIFLKQKPGLQKAALA